MASSSFSSSFPSPPLSFIATDSNLNNQLITFAPHSTRFPLLAKPNHPCAPATLRTGAQAGSWEPNQSPERPKWRTRVSFFPSFLTKKSKSREEIKQKLLDAIAPLDRGAEATSEDQERIDEITRELEAVNSTKEPLKSDLLNGKWELLYTTSASILKTQRPKILRPNGKIYQAINADTLRTQNMESWPFFNQAIADLIPINSRRVAVKFDTFKIAGLIPIKAPDRSAEDRGQVEITYLDEEIRVSRGNRGNLFILKMVDPSYRIPV